MTAVPTLSLIGQKCIKFSLLFHRSYKVKVLKKVHSNKVKKCIGICDEGIELYVGKCIEVVRCIKIPSPYLQSSGLLVAKSYIIAYKHVTHIPELKQVYQRIFF